jgi:hypothetical protein
VENSFSFKTLLIAIILIAMPFAIKAGDSKDAKYKKEGIQVEATVVNKQKMGISRKAGYAYDVVYKDENGNEITADAILNTNAEIGDVLTVRYLKDTPNKVYRSPSGMLKSVTNILGILSCLTGCLMIFFMFKKKDNNDIELDLHEVKEE